MTLGVKEAQNEDLGLKTGHWSRTLGLDRGTETEIKPLKGA